MLLNKPLVAYQALSSLVRYNEYYSLCLWKVQCMASSKTLFSEHFDGLVDYTVFFYYNSNKKGYNKSTQRVKMELE